MREIEFRGMTLDGEWVYGSLIQSKSGQSLIKEKTILGLGAICTMTDCFDEIDTGTIGQYTGLKDKSGTKIFEGDILHGISINGTIAPCVVEWDTGGFVVKQICGRCSYSDDLYSNVKHSEIHGNIHETET